MDNFADERDYKILEQDKYTFSVLGRIIGGECALLLTDHARLIICFSRKPFPVWIWTSDDVTGAEKEQAYETVRENGLLTAGHSFNMKYDLADYFIKRASEKSLNLSITTNMLAYDCPSPAEPHIKSDGGLHRCTADDIDELVDFQAFFHQETGIDKESRDAYRQKVEEAVRRGSLFFWRNAAGKNVSCCSCNLRPGGGMASIGLVYTRAEFRRKHYAENLVYQVSKMANDAGYTPMLYTDADYTASNACYQKIGYVLRGRLCTVGKKD